ncbi:hypothetical protein QOT17_004051 [Balamuthia mandrillaris]
MSKRPVLVAYGGGGRPAETLAGSGGRGRGRGRGREGTSEAGRGRGGRNARRRQNKRQHKEPQPREQGEHEGGCSLHLTAEDRVYASLFRDAKRLALSRYYAATAARQNKKEKGKEKEKEKEEEEVTTTTATTKEKGEEGEERWGKLLKKPPPELLQLEERPLSLMRQCLNLLVRDLDCCQSLEGLPLSIQRMLFRHASKRHLCTKHFVHLFSSSASSSASSSSASSQLTEAENEKEKEREETMEKKEEERKEMKVMTRRDLQLCRGITKDGLKALGKRAEVQELDLSRARLVACHKVGPALAQHLVHIRSLSLAGYVGILKEADILAITERRNIEDLDLSKTNVNRAMVDLLASKMWWLRALSLKKCKKIMGHVVELKNLKKLLVLNVSGTHFSFLPYISRMKDLEVLDMSRVQFEEDEFAELSHLRKLRFLNLYCTPTGNKELEHVNGLNELRSLDLQDTCVTNKVITTVLSHLPMLSYLNLVNTYISDPIASLAALPNLSCVTLFGSRVPKSVASKLKDGMQVDKPLVLRGKPSLTQCLDMLYDHFDRPDAVEFILRSFFVVLAQPDPTWVPSTRRRDFPLERQHILQKLNTLETSTRQYATPSNKHREEIIKRRKGESWKHPLDPGPRAFRSFKLAADFISSSSAFSKTSLLDPLLALIYAYHTQPSILTKVLHLLSMLILNNGTQRPHHQPTEEALRTDSGQKLLLGLLWLYPNQPLVVRYVLALMGAVCKEGESTTSGILLSNLGAHGLLLEVMALHNEDVMVVAMALDLLQSCLVRTTSPLSAIKFFKGNNSSSSNDEEDGGLKAVVLAMKEHPREPKVMAPAIKLLLKLLKIEEEHPEARLDITSRMQRAGVVHAVVFALEVASRKSSRKPLVTNADALLSKLLQDHKQEFPFNQKKQLRTLYGCIKEWLLSLQKSDSNGGSSVASPLHQVQFEKIERSGTLLIFSVSFILC